MASAFDTLPHDPSQPDNGEDPHPAWLEAVKRIRSASCAAFREGLEDVGATIDECALDLERKIGSTAAHTREGVRAKVEAYMLNAGVTADFDDDLIFAGRDLCAIQQRELTEFRGKYGDVDNDETAQRTGTTDRPGSPAL